MGASAKQERELSTMPVPAGMRWDHSRYTPKKAILWAEGSLWSLAYAERMHPGTRQPWEWATRTPGTTRGFDGRRGRANTRELACTAIMAALDDMLEFA